MPSTNLAEKIVTEFNGRLINGDAHFYLGDSQFAFTDGTIYQSIDGKLSQGYQKVKTLKAVKKFVELRA